MGKVTVTKRNVLARIRKKLKKEGQRFVKASTPQIESAMGARWLIIEGSGVVGFADDLETVARNHGLLEDFEQLEPHGAPLGKDLRVMKHVFPGLVRSQASGGGDARPPQRVSAADVAFMSAAKFRLYLQARNQWPEPMRQEGTRNPGEKFIPSNRWYRGPR
jgi:hypothetical protein